jgi:hypothetical protein
LISDAVLNKHTNLIPLLTFIVLLKQEPSSNVKFQDLDVYGNEILAKHGMNAEYN